MQLRSANVFYLKKDQEYDPKLFRYVHKDEYDLYADSYSLSGEEYTVNVWNRNGVTGEEYWETFKIPKKFVKEIVLLT